MLFCISFTQSERFLHTGLFISRLRRVVAEPDHTHTTWPSSQERHADVPTVHISPFCVIHRNIPTVILVSTSALTCVERVDHSEQYHVVVVAVTVHGFHVLAAPVLVT